VIRSDLLVESGLARVGDTHPSFYFTNPQQEHQPLFSLINHPPTSSPLNNHQQHFETKTRHNHNRRPLTTRPSRRSSFLATKKSLVASKFQQQHTTHLPLPSTLPPYSKLYDRACTRSHDPFNDPHQGPLTSTPHTPLYFLSKTYTYSTSPQ
jgi:hypothetical protein